MNSVDSGDFDVAALMNVCSQWPALTVPAVPAKDTLLERLRQVLVAMGRHPASASETDCIALIRHVLLRVATQDGQAPWLRVPLSVGWPAADQWRQAQFEVLPGPSSLNVQPRWPRLSFLDTQADLFDDVFRAVQSRPRYEVPADPLLLEGMGLPTYTGQGQREAVRALLHLPEGNTLIANLPTGSGKSLLAHLPPLVEQEGQMTLAIVPTVALAMDQASRMMELLRQRFPYRDFPPLAFHGGLTKEERAQVHQAIREGTQPILFASPEYAVGSLRDGLEQAASEARLHRVFIDEAHLVIGWGNGFRPAFQLLPALVRMLRSRARHNGIRVVLASATLTDTTLRDLRQLFGPAHLVHVVSAVHLRPEIRYASVPCAEPERVDRVLEAVQLAPRPFILYVTRPEEADAWLHRLRQAGLKRLSKFTGATVPDERKRLLEAWGSNELDGMVATSAFGLGVDKSDVRTVIHATLPESLDRYYQEVGRAGRDGRAGAALLLHTPSDEEQASSLALPKLIGDEKAFERWSGMVDGAQPHLKIPEVYWVDLTRLPSHLQVKSEASVDWSVRALTLMARAQLIELVAMQSDQALEDETPLNINDATRAAVRILSDGHRHPGVFASAMARARDEVRRASLRGLDAMRDVAAGRLDISVALNQMYSVHGDPWVPVTTCCGGCALHWENRRETVQYAAPVAARLPAFAPRSLVALDRMTQMRALGNLLVIAAPRDKDLTQTCSQLLATLAPLVACHTVAWDPDFAAKSAPLVKQSIPTEQRLRTFFDTLPPDSLRHLTSGEGEVRILIWTQNDTAELWSHLKLSPALLEILVIPADLPHPDHPMRRLIDTTPYTMARDFLQILNP
jgi:ATP-dependent DNA helicase RecQ